MTRPKKKKRARMSFLYVLERLCADDQGRFIAPHRLVLRRCASSGQFPGRFGVGRPRHFCLRTAHQT